MLSNNGYRPILGALLAASLIGCRSAPHRASDWTTEMAANTTYASPADQTAGHPSPADDEWVCPMHPQVRRPEPGECPACGMDLVRADRSDDGESAPARSARSHGSGASHSPSSGCGHCG